VGRRRPSRVRCVQAGQDQSQLLDERPQRTHRADLRRERPRRAGSQPKISTSPRVISFGSECRVRGRPLRRHHAHVPQQHVPRRPAQRRASTTSPRWRSRRSRSSDYNQGNPDGILDPREQTSAAEGAARRDLPQGGTLSRTVRTHPRCAMGEQKQKDAAKVFKIS